jgi:hypothetical protein
MTPKWKCGASLNLPLGDPDEPWDGADAARKLAAYGDAQRGFLAYASDRSAYVLPFAKVIRGEIVAVPAGLAEARRNLASFGLPLDVRRKALAVLDVYADARREVSPWPPSWLRAQSAARVRL